LLERTNQAVGCWALLEVEKETRSRSTLGNANRLASNVRNKNQKRVPSSSFAFAVGVHKEQPADWHSVDRESHGEQARLR
jgi:hypothetical protein